MARRCLPRGDARIEQPLPAPVPAREPALADYAWPSARGGSRRRRDRARRAAGRARALARRRPHPPSFPTLHAVAGGCADAAQALPEPYAPRAGADDLAGLPLQRDLLFLSIDTRRLLLRADGRCRRLRPSARALH